MSATKIAARALPMECFGERHGFAANSAWYEHPRSAAVRLTGCSAAFVSQHGLVATNDHRAPRAISSVQREQRTLLDDGFVARPRVEHRRIPCHYVDPPVAIEDVIEEVFGAQGGIQAEPRRNVMADVRAIRPSLRHVYGMDRLPDELARDVPPR